MLLASQLNFVLSKEEFKKTILISVLRRVKYCYRNNSDAIINNSKFSLDWVRPGILLYGAPSSLNPNFEMKTVLNSLQPCQSLQTEIMQLKSLKLARQ